MYDVIVVGAGCAGLSTARLLALRGRRVLVVDRWPPDDRGRIDDLGPVGTAMLGRWGMLDRPGLREGTLGSDRRGVHAGGTALEIENRRFLGRSGSVSVLRQALVDELLRCAVAAGATVRWDFTVSDVLWRDGRAVGVVGNNGHEQSVFERARVVVGADGHRSVVARAAGVNEHGPGAATNCCFSARWRGVHAPTPEAFFGEGLVVTLVPHLGQAAQVTVWLPISEWATFKRKPQATYQRQLERFPGVVERLAGATRETRLAGTAELATDLRPAFGSGWALVGDAGQRVDPLASPGIAEAFIQAEFLADAIDAGLSRKAGLAAALARYAERRNARARAIQPLAREMSSYQWALSDVPALLRALDIAHTARCTFGQ